MTFWEGAVFSEHRESDKSNRTGSEPGTKNALGVAALLATSRVYPTELNLRRLIQDHALGPNSPNPMDGIRSA